MADDLQSLRDKVTILESMLGVIVEEKEADELRQALYSLFAQQAVIQARREEVLSQESHADIWYPEGMVVPFQSKAGWTAWAEENGLVEGEDYEFIPNGAIVYITPSANATIIPGPEEYVLKRENLPVFRIDGPSFIPPTLNDVLVLGEYGQGNQVSLFNVNGDSSEMPTTWTDTTAMFKHGLIWNNLVTTAPFHSYGVQTNPDLRSNLANLKGPVPVPCSLEPGESSVTAFTRGFTEGQTISGSVQWNFPAWAGRTKPWSAGSQDPTPVPTAPLKWAVCLVKILRDVKLKLPLTG